MVGVSASHWQIAHGNAISNRRRNDSSSVRVSLLINRARGACPICSRTTHCCPDTHTLCPSKQPPPGLLSSCPVDAVVDACHHTIGHALQHFLTEICNIYEVYFYIYFYNTYICTTALYMSFLFVGLFNRGATEQGICPIRHALFVLQIKE